MSFDNEIHDFNLFFTTRLDNYISKIFDRRPSTKLIFFLTTNNSNDISLLRMVNLSLFVCFLTIFILKINHF